MNFLGKLLRVALVAALILLLILCRLVAGALIEPAWEVYARVRGLASDSVGGPIQADTPFARSVEDLEFTVQMVQERWDDAEYFHLGDAAYRVLTLESGERVAALVNADNCQYEGKVTSGPLGSLAAQQPGAGSIGVAGIGAGRYHPLCGYGGIRPG